MLAKSVTYNSKNYAGTLGSSLTRSNIKTVLWRKSSLLYSAIFNIKFSTWVSFSWTIQVIFGPNGTFNLPLCCYIKLRWFFEVSCNWHITRPPTHKCVLLISRVNNGDLLICILIHMYWHKTSIILVNK